MAVRLSALCWEAGTFDKKGNRIVSVHRTSNAICAPVGNITPEKRLILLQHERTQAKVIFSPHYFPHRKGMRTITMAFFLTYEEDPDYLRQLPGHMMNLGPSSVITGFSG
jgi:hypothetical protein